MTTMTCDLNQNLESSLSHLVLRIENAEFYKVLFDKRVDAAIVTNTLKHVYLSIAQYQPHVTEATFTAVGRMPKQSESLIKDMILQQVEEVEHAEMALRDFRRLGGDESLITSAMFPECAAVAAVCRFLGEHCHPASYLGFMYIFEALTPIMAVRTQELMSENDYPSSAREFIDLHATEDIRHTEVVVQAMNDLIKICPEAEPHIHFGFEVFAAVYPIPVWQVAYERALADTPVAC